MECGRQLERCLSNQALLAQTKHCLHSQVSSATCTASSRTPTARRFWDWRSGNCFQQGQTIPQPGSLDSEAGIYALAFDKSGSRLITCEADKSIKMWKENPEASEESHPISFRPPKDIVRRY